MTGEDDQPYPPLRLVGGINDAVRQEFSDGVNGRVGQISDRPDQENKRIWDPSNGSEDDQPYPVLRLVGGRLWNAEPI